MDSLRKFIEGLSDGEEIIAVQIGEWGWGDYPTPIPEGLNNKELFGKILTEDQAKIFLDHEFVNEFGAPHCNAFVAFTKTWVISLSEYDGSVSPFRIPRNPVDGFIPYMYGG